jgi:hypothetical protein
MLKFIPNLMCNETLLLVQCVFFLILNGLDGYTTWLVLKPDHYERERNPVARWVFHTLKAPGAIFLFKALLLGFLGVFIAYWWNEALTLNLALLIGNLLFLYVVPHNFGVYRKYQEQEQMIAEIQKVHWVVE